MKKLLLTVNAPNIGGALAPADSLIIKGSGGIAAKVMPPLGEQFLAQHAAEEKLKSVSGRSNKEIL